MIRKLKYIFFVLALIPLLRLFWLGIVGALGANPVEFVIQSLGTWTLVMLLFTLALSPLRNLIKAAWPLQMRRMVGLFTFFYACLHFLSYAGLDQWFEWHDISNDIVKHPYVLVGFLAFVLLIPLAATSTDAMMKRLGRRWKPLHRVVYLIAVLGIIHYWWLVKKDVTEPVIYSVIAFVLLAARLRSWLPMPNMPNRATASISINKKPATDVI